MLARRNLRSVEPKPNLLQIGAASSLPRYSRQALAAGCALLVAAAG